ncbi:MAG TPA: DUF3052 domain-containing protein [Actinomycetota bacterium]
MAGSPPHKDYSGTPLQKKLGIGEGSRVVVAGGPDGFDLGALPRGASMLRRAARPTDVALLFVTRRSELQRRFGPLARALDPAGRLWVAWPKKAADVDTDLSFEVVQRVGLDAGLVDNKSASIDDTFQGLQFVYRLADRPKR